MTIKRHTLSRVLFLTLCAVLSFSANAHFQMLYTPQLLLSHSTSVQLKMPFTHPASSGNVMKVDKPISFVVIKKGKKTNLLSTLSPITWTSAVSANTTYQADVKLKGLGDYVFLFNAQPYFDKDENGYIQQFTKTILNVGNFPTDWDKDFGEVAEIVPLTKPYDIYVGGVFTGVVKSSGKAVPFAEIEVAFINYLPNMKQNRFSKTATVNAKNNAFVTQTLRADKNGTFHFSLLKAGQWGFSAVDIGPSKKYKGKVLSQEAIIWVQAHALPR